MCYLNNFWYNQQYLYLGMLVVRTMFSDVSNFVNPPWNCPLKIKHFFHQIFVQLANLPKLDGGRPETMSAFFWFFGPTLTPPPPSHYVPHYADVRFRKVNSDNLFFPLITFKSNSLTDGSWIPVTVKLISSKVQPDFPFLLRFFTV